MNCCDHCFKDVEIKGFIYDNSTETGKCDFCSKDNAALLDPRELEEMFQPIFGLFKPVADLGLEESDGKSLSDSIQEQWKIFNHSDKSIIHRLVYAISADVFPADNELLNSNVQIGVLFEQLDSTITHERRWDNFTKEIKYGNRFFLTETIDLDLLQYLLTSLSRFYKPGKIFYRARISKRTGLPLAEMGKPPIHKVGSGRANPNGIPYLYVSTTMDTTVYETRCTYLDFLTVAEFKLIEPLKVISLRAVSEVSPFLLQDRLEEYFIHEKYLARLEAELSKPIRRFDQELDYLPTQYLCEYVKSLGYDAIEYGSALKNGGINLAIFNDEKLSPQRATVYEIVSLDLKTERVLTE